MVLKTNFSFFKEVFSPSHIPKVGLQKHLFGAEPTWFYFRRLPEMSPFYLLGLLGLLKIFSRRDGDRLLCLYCLVILVFHSWWANYQTRYVVSALPVILIIAASLLREGWTSLEKLTSQKKILIARIFYSGAVIYFIVKTLIVAYNIALPNNASYF